MGVIPPREILDGEESLTGADVLVDRLMQIVRDGTDADALRAMDSMLSRVYGRPKETVEVAQVKEPETLEQLRSLTREERKALMLNLEEQGRPRLPR